MNRELWRPALRLIVLLNTVVLLSGCTSALWQRDRFARDRQPATPNQLQLFYSEQRKDVLVQYNESRDEDELVRTRAYWLEPNSAQVSGGHKPKFVSIQKVHDLVPISVTNQPPVGSSPSELKASVFDDTFTLYSGDEQLNVYTLPVYHGASQRVKQVLLTPFAVIVDATIVGAIIASQFRP